VSLTYAIADLHGRFDLLDAALDAIIDHATGPFTVVTLGDYIDRGPDSRKIIEALMMGSSGDSKLICLKGNHEDIMFETVMKPLDPDWWIGNGGGATLLSYGHPPRGQVHLGVVPQEHLKWIASLPRYYEDAYRVYVHAGVSESYALAEQPEQVLAWYIYPDGADVGYRGKHVVHGHHQFADGPKCYANRTDLDTFAWLTGRIVVGVFDDDIAGGPIDIIEVKGPPSPHYRGES
jgi:serine/threonine protein phosphatase 1